MSQISNCGERLPFRNAYQPNNNPGNTGGTIIIYDPPDPIDPWRPQEPESWVCICTGQLSEGFRGCENERSRECIKIESAGTFPRSANVYQSKADCEANAFGQFPCALSLFKCVEFDQRPCPTPLFGIIITRSCVEQLPVANRPNPLPPDTYDTAARCALNCTNTELCRQEYDPYGPTTTRPAIPSTTGTRRGYKCSPVSVQSCPDSSEITIQIRECIECNYDGSDPECIYNSSESCYFSCKSDKCLYKCVETTRSCPNPPFQVTGTICAQCKFDPYDPTTNDCNKLRGCDNTCREPRCADVTVTSVGTVLTVGQVDPPQTTGTTGVLNQPYVSRYKGVTERNIPRCRQCTQIEVYSQNGFELCPYTSLQQCIDDYLIANPQPFDPQIPIVLTGVDATTVVDLGLRQYDATSEEIFTLNKSKDTNVYDPIYNFFSKKPNNKTSYVKNNFRLDIFGKYISKEVNTIISHNLSENKFWKEELLSDLTIPKIAISLNSDLLKSINSIHSVDNTLINPNNIYEVIRKLLLTNKLDEFDPNFYINLAQTQSKDKLVEYRRSSSLDVQETAGIGIATNNSISADHKNYENQAKFKILRQKRLNTDIDTNLSITTSSTISVPLQDAGVPIYQIDASNIFTFVPIGIGDDYFIPVYSPEEVKIPLNTQINNALLVPERVREVTLKAFNSDSSYTLIASSLVGQHEFNSSYELSGSLEPMYFALDLSSIEDLDKSNPLIDKLKAKYRLLTNNQEIQNHVYNYGYTVSRFNIDFRDPFAYYIRDTQQFDFIQNDLTFRYFNLNVSGTLNKDLILTRTLPFGIVVVPGCGSQHNPFHGMSRLENLDNNKVVRTIKGLATIDRSDTNPKEFVILSSVTTDNIQNNVPEDYYEYSNKFYYVFDPNTYLNTYYYKGQYTSEKPNNIVIKKPITSHVVNNIVDTLKTAYNPLELKWFDVYSRMSFTEICDLFYESTYDYFNKLETGWRNILIKPVLRTSKETKSYIDPTIIPEVEVPQPIITKENRFNDIS